MWLLTNLPFLELTFNTPSLRLFILQTGKMLHVRMRVMMAGNKTEMDLAKTVFRERSVSLSLLSFLTPSPSL